MKSLYLKTKKALSQIVNFDQYKDYYINLALRQNQGNSYVEIGVRNGDCFRRISCDFKVAIDPHRTPEFFKLRPGESFFEIESDNFFSQYSEDIFSNQKICVALVDGLHEYHQALRDVLNLERYMAKNGVIFIHDCNPESRKRAEIRDGGPWNGDVWKVAYYLKHFRQDLNFLTINCDTGLGVLTGFREQISFEKNDESIARCKDLDFSVLEQNREIAINLKSIEYAKQFFKSMH